MVFQMISRFWYSCTTLERNDRVIARNPILVANILSKRVDKEAKIAFWYGKIAVRSLVISLFDCCGIKDCSNSSLICGKIVWNWLQTKLERGEWIESKEKGITSKNLLGVTLLHSSGAQRGSLPFGENISYSCNCNLNTKVVK